MFDLKANNLRASEQTVSEYEKAKIEKGLILFYGSSGFTRWASEYGIRPLEEDIRILWIGGHSPGSCVVEILKDGQILVLCGDECYHPYNLQMKEPTASSCCPERSRAFVETYTKPPYVCLLCHEVIV